MDRFMAVVVQVQVRGGAEQLDTDLPEPGLGR